MKKTLLSAVSAFAIFLAGGVALAQDQDTSGAANGTPETSTQDGASTGPTGTGTTTGTDDGATSDAPAGTATDMDTDTTDVPAAGDTGTSTGGAATGDDAGTTMPDVGDDDTSSTMTTETTTPVDFTQLHPYDGDPTGITVEGVPAEDIVGGTLVNAEGETIADINDLLVDSDGEPQALLVGFGGFLGLMEKSVAVGFDRVELTANDEDEYVTDLTEQEIEAMPEYEEPET